jgi:ssDNA-specific exonuclease RecJ
MGFTAKEKYARYFRCIRVFQEVDLHDKGEKMVGG